MFWKIQGELVEVPKNKNSEIYHISQIFNGFEDSFDRVRTYTQAAERFLSLCGKSICADSFLDISKLIQRFFKRSFFHTFYSKTVKNIDFSPKLKTFKLTQDFSKDRFFHTFYSKTVKNNDFSPKLKRSSSPKIFQKIKISNFLLKNNYFSRFLVNGILL